MISKRVVCLASVAILMVSMTAARAGTGSSHAIARHVADDACKLLSTDDASTALGQTSQPGAQEFGTGCVWSHEAPPRDSSRQLHVEFHTTRAYGIAKGGNTITKIEPVSGVGDDAFYQLYTTGGTPFLWVKKGEKTISIRINIRRKDPPFTTEQLKSKLLALGKAAAGKM